MMNKRQIERLTGKQNKFAERLRELMFIEIDRLDVEAFETFDKLDKAPDVSYKKIKPGHKWGAERIYCWFKTAYEVPAEYAGVDLYLLPESDGIEGLLFVNGVPFTNFAGKSSVALHSSHHCKVFAHSPKAGEVYNLDLEVYAGHNGEGSSPFENARTRSYDLTANEFKVCIKDELVSAFYYDLRTLQSLYEVLDEDSFRRAELTNTFVDLHDVLYYSMENIDRQTLEESLRKGREIMAPVLAKKNGDSAPAAGITGHSHMDTAWHWEIDETIKKCARTFSNQISLMDRYPEYRFMQSSAAHLRFIEIHYPELFEKIKQKVLEGRYEPNGGVWIECDCNITSGEFFIRHFLWGQNYTRKHFGYTSNSFFLPDTFGYSAALPQIMKGCEIDYFLTTKISWSDTNKFPYDTFYWEGIDGTKVFTHFNKLVAPLMPKDVYGVIDKIAQKEVTNQRLLTYGRGDGGGGPEDYMPEIARRMADLDGCPKTYHISVADFMTNLEQNAIRPNTYRGELYLEGHRGTLTSQHNIKRNNRKAEIAIRNAELFTVADAIKNRKKASSKEIAPLVETLLINQFHDILPGTSIEPVHVRSVTETTEIIEKSGKIVKRMLKPSEDSPDNKVTVINPLSFERGDCFEIELGTADRYVEEDCNQQIITKIDGSRVLRVSGVKLGAFAGRVFTLTDQKPAEVSPFVFADKTLTTPYAKVIFDDNGYISSFTDTRTGRELRGGKSLNTFLFGEDVPLAWDNWDIDADTEYKLRDSVKLTSFEIAANGSVEFRIRIKYAVSDKTELTQDMVFYTDSPRVDFESVIDWNDKHRLLKVLFDTTVKTDYATQEIQYGNVKRPTNRNTTIEQARFEICNHKYTDLSEPEYGVALLNDCKYGVSINDRAIALTLHKGGCKPDARGDSGLHEFVYSFYPHTGAFGSDTVQESYCLNNPAIAAEGVVWIPELVSVQSPNIIIETIKPCEQNSHAYIVRMYESTGAYTSTKMTASARSVCQTNMLEKPITGILDFNEITHDFKPFEIKTFKVEYMFGGIEPVINNDDKAAPPIFAPQTEQNNLIGKAVSGYQLWFKASQDLTQGWRHWSRKSAPGNGNLSVEMFPDISEYPDSLMYKTNMSNLGNGKPAKLYNSTDQEIIDIQVSWLRDCDSIDGLAIQRFYGATSTEYTDQENHLQRVMRSAEKYGKLFYVMYDTSGSGGDNPNIFDRMTLDFINNVERKGVASSTAYAHADGKPVVCIWGIAGTDPHRYPNAETSLKLINWFKDRGYFVIGGLPDNRWTTITDEFAAVYQALDMASPWTVGRYNINTAETWLGENLPKDTAYCKKHGIKYQPVIFPGFAWSKWNTGKVNAYPRMSGEFTWNQVKMAIKANADVLYFAMYDEYDEGTAHMKAAEDYFSIPTDQFFQTLAIDGNWLSSDYYLRLAGRAAKMFRGEVPFSETPDIPYSSGPVYWRNSFEKRETEYLLRRNEEKRKQLVNIDVCLHNPAVLRQDNVTIDICDIQKTDRAKSGEYVFRLKGRSSSADSGYVYKIADTKIAVEEDMELSYAILPVPNSEVIIDLLFDNGTRLDGTAAYDISGSAGQWLDVTVKIPAEYKGRVITGVAVVCDGAADFDVMIDDVVIKKEQ
ncbi:MAG: glycosyl hydrolase-related protein [Oscillospiraceae bacterium]|nr:glycosyl hydrolase-related protein [Oscillospiraceae bacterium]